MGMRTPRCKGFFGHFTSSPLMGCFPISSAFLDNHGPPQNSRKTTHDFTSLHTLSFPDPTVTMFVATARPVMLVDVEVTVLVELAESELVGLFLGRVPPPPTPDPPCPPPPDPAPLASAPRSRAKICTRRAIRCGVESFMECQQTRGDNAISETRTPSWVRLQKILRQHLPGARKGGKELFSGQHQQRTALFDLHVGPRIFLKLFLNGSGDSILRRGSCHKLRHTRGIRNGLSVSKSWIRERTKKE